MQDIERTMIRAGYKAGMEYWKSTPADQRGIVDLEGFVSDAMMDVGGDEIDGDIFWEMVAHVTESFYAGGSLLDILGGWK